MTEMYNRLLSLWVRGLLTETQIWAATEKTPPAITTAQAQAIIATPVTGEDPLVNAAAATS